MSSLFTGKQSYRFLARHLAHLLPMSYLLSVGLEPVKPKLAVLQLSVFIRPVQIHYLLASDFELIPQP